MSADPYEDQRWLWLADRDFDADPDDDEEPYPELPPGWHIVHYRHQMRIAIDLPDIADYQDGRPVDTIHDIAALTADRAQ